MLIGSGNETNEREKKMKSVGILLLFSVAMFAIPLGGFYLSRGYLFEGK